MRFDFTTVDPKGLDFFFQINIFRLILRNYITFWNVLIKNDVKELDSMVMAVKWEESACRTLGSRDGLIFPNYSCDLWNRPYSLHRFMAQPWWYQLVHSSFGVVYSQGRGCCTLLHCYAEAEAVSMSRDTLTWHCCVSLACCCNGATTRSSVSYYYLQIALFEV